jgi:hypothetical protein
MKSKKRRNQKMSKQENSVKAIDVIRYLMNYRNAKEFLKRLDIDDVVTVHDVHHWVSDDERERFVITMQQKNLVSRTEVYVDFKPGHPSTDQVYEAVYGMGKYCQKRVIVFTNEYIASEGWNPTVDKMPVESLIETLNECPLDIYLVKLEGPVFPFEIYGMDIVEKPECGPKYGLIPPPIEFRAEEFWSIYFDWHNEGWYEPWTVFDSGFRSIEDWGHMLWTEPEVAEIPVYWTESGVSYHVNQVQDDDDYLKKIWELKQDELKERYQGRVEFEFLLGRLPKITVKYSDRPASWLITAAPKVRLEFAKQLHDDVFGFRWYLGEAIEEAETVLAA